MAKSEQNQLRDEMLALCFPYIDKDIKNVVNAYVACIGAAAVCAAVLPPKHRERLILETEGTLLAHANKRAADLRDGRLDAQLATN